jgi:hypothetical protein
MAGESFKLTKKVADEAVDLLKQAKTGDKLDDLANKVGLDVEVLDEIVEKGVKNVKGGRGVLGSVVEKLGGAIEGVQAEVNTLLGRRRAIPEGTTPPSAAGTVDITGPVDGVRGKGFTMQAEPRGGRSGRRCTRQRLYNASRAERWTTRKNCRNSRRPDCRPNY